MSVVQLSINKLISKRVYATGAKFAHENSIANTEIASILGVVGDDWHARRWARDEDAPLGLGMCADRLAALDIGGKGAQAEMWGWRHRAGCWGWAAAVGREGRRGLAA
jgi:hypothetical protein